jgi:hypothetical protein
MSNRFKTIVVLVIVLAAVTAGAHASDSEKSISPELKTTLEAMKKLDGADITAIASWLKGEGRAKLRAQGADDKAIGPARPAM